MLLGIVITEPISLGVHAASDMLPSVIPFPTLGTTFTDESTVVGSGLTTTMPSTPVKTGTVVTVIMAYSSHYGVEVKSYALPSFVPAQVVIEYHSVTGYYGMGLSGDLPTETVTETETVTVTQTTHETVLVTPASSANSTPRLASQGVWYKVGTFLRFLGGSGLASVGCGLALSHAAAPHCVIISSIGANLSGGLATSIWSGTIVSNAVNIPVLTVGAVGLGIAYGVRLHGCEYMATSKHYETCLSISNQVAVAAEGMSTGTLLNIINKKKHVLCNRSKHI